MIYIYNYYIYIYNLFLSILYTVSQINRLEMTKVSRSFTRAPFARPAPKRVRGMQWQKFTLSLLYGEVRFLTQAFNIS